MGIQKGKNQIEVQNYNYIKQPYDQFNYEAIFPFSKDHFPFKNGLTGNSLTFFQKTDINKQYFEKKMRLH